MMMMMMMMMTMVVVIMMRMKEKKNLANLNIFVKYLYRFAEHIYLIDPTKRCKLKSTKEHSKTREIYCFSLLPVKEITSGSSCARMILDR